MGIVFTGNLHPGVHQLLTKFPINVHACKHACKPIEGFEACSHVSSTLWVVRYSLEYACMALHVVKIHNRKHNFCQKTGRPVLINPIQIFTISYGAARSDYFKIDTACCWHFPLLYTKQQCNYSRQRACRSCTGRLVPDIIPYRTGDQSGPATRAFTYEHSSKVQLY